MRSIRQFFGSQDDVPGWARFFDPGAFRAFVAVLEAELAKRGGAFTVGDGVVTGAAGESYGIVNLAQVCNQAPRDQWTAIVADHFRRIEKSRGEAGGLEVYTDFEKARGLLKVRLYPDDFPTPPEAVYRVPAQGLVAMLVYDLPTSVATVPPAHARGWGRTDDDLIRLGLENVRREPVLSPQVTQAGGAEINAILGESFFTSSRLLMLEDFVKDAPLGALAAAPHRHAVLYHVIRDRSALKAVNALIPAAFGMFQEGPGSILPNLYWWRDGRLLLLPSRVTAKNIEFAPPPEFVEDVLNRLG